MRATCYTRDWYIQADVRSPSRISERSVSGAASRELQILGLKDHPLSPELLKFAADMNVTPSLHP